MSQQPADKDEAVRSIINAFPVRIGPWFEVQEHFGTHNVTLARCNDHASAARIIAALRTPLPECGALPSKEAIKAATLHCKAPSGSFPTYSEIRCMADEILRLAATPPSTSGARALRKEPGPPAGTPAAELDFMLTQFQTWSEASADDTASSEDSKYAWKQAQEIKQEIIQKFAPATTVSAIQPTTKGTTMRDEPYDIIVNGTTHQVALSSISYERVMELAGFDPKRNYSMTYTTLRKGDEQRQGILSPGRTTPLEDGMVFEAVNTSNA